MKIFSCITPWLILVLAMCVLLLPGLPLANCDDDDDLPTPVAGLAYGFYEQSCPQAEEIVREIMKDFLTPNRSQAAGVIRLFFHDCFVQGCDGSVLVNDSQGEQPAIPNQTLRASALAIIDTIKAQLESTCPNTVSCADILVLAAREAVKRAHGKHVEVPTGRRDSLNFANSTTVLNNLPAPFFNLSELLSSFSSKGLTATDLVALSGAHTVGLAHCSSFSNRLRPTVDPLLNAAFATSLIQTCPDSSVNVAVDMDIRTPNKFDNKYFKNILYGEVLFDSDAALASIRSTKDIVKEFAFENDKFLKQFAISFIKMSMIQVLTGSQGNIRQVCSVLDGASTISSTTTHDISSTDFIAAEIDAFSASASM